MPIAATHRTLAITVLVSCALLACSSPVPNRNPVGEVFPPVSGESLAGQSRAVPVDLPAGPVVLLVGYVQNAQFDIDRWLLGLALAGWELPVFEIPTIKGIVPGLIAGSIDAGMRRGIPREDWAAVITVYDDAASVVDFTGNDNPNNARVLLLDDQRRVIWFHDRGFSPSTLLSLLAEAGVTPTCIGPPEESISGKAT